MGWFCRLEDYPRRLSRRHETLMDPGGKLEQRLVMYPGEERKGGSKELESFPPAYKNMF